jgi:hypothetical protein
VAGGFTRIRFRRRPDEGHSRVRYADSGARISCQCILRGVPALLFVERLPCAVYRLILSCSNSLASKLRANKPYSSCFRRDPGCRPVPSDSISALMPFL